MLVARTKKETDALPRQPVAVSSARMLSRRSPGFPRAERILASEENRRMIQSVDQSIEMAHEASKQASAEQDRADATRRKHQSESESLAYVQSRLHEARVALGIAMTETQTAQQQFDVLVRARDRVNTEISVKSADVIQLETRLRKDREAAGEMEKKITEFTKSLHDTALAKTRSEQERRDLESKIVETHDRLKIIEKEIVAGEQAHNLVMSTIEEATTSFRIFERRIGRLSRETGYIIGYKKLK